MKKIKECSLIILLIITISLVFDSCTEYKDIPYLSNISNTAKDSLVNTAPFNDPVIMPDDILSYSLITIDPTTAAPVNQSASMMMVPGQTNSVIPSMVPGLLVDKNGTISLPIIGMVKVGGLTTAEARDLIKQKASQYFKEPDVQVRFANFTVTVLGEVMHPSTFVIPSEKVSVLDALGMAGDLTIYGMRENVLVIREVDGKKVVNRLNLNNSDLFSSPFFYLKQNDIVYVQPNKQKAIAADAARTRTYTILAAVATIIIILVSRIK